MFEYCVGKGVTPSWARKDSRGGPKKSSSPARDEGTHNRQNNAAPNIKQVIRSDGEHTIPAVLALDYMLDMAISPSLRVAAKRLIRYGDHWLPTPFIQGRKESVCLPVMAA